MKMSNLKASAYQEEEVLTRSQLKTVLGGGVAAEAVSCSESECQSATDCPIDQFCKVGLDCRDSSGNMQKTLRLCVPYNP